MMLVGDVANRICILIDDLADTSNTITRAAKLLKKEGATKVYALLTHGVLSGDAIERINASALDKVVVTNSVPQEEHMKRCPKLEVLEIGEIFAEVSKALLFLPLGLGRGGEGGEEVGGLADCGCRRFGGSIMVRVSACCFNMIEGNEVEFSFLHNSC